MRDIIRDASLDADRHLGILEVWYPDSSEWDTAAFNELKEKELEAIREEGREYDRETWFRQEPFFRYFRKFRKTSPVMRPRPVTKNKNPVPRRQLRGIF